MSEFVAWLSGAWWWLVGAVAVAWAIFRRRTPKNIRAIGAETALDREQDLQRDLTTIRTDTAAKTAAIDAATDAAATPHEVAAAAASASAIEVAATPAAQVTQDLLDQIARRNNVSMPVVRLTARPRDDQ
jgi:hypothetical protein